MELKNSHFEWLPQSGSWRWMACVEWHAQVPFLEMHNSYPEWPTPVREDEQLFILNNYPSLVHESEWLFTLNDYLSLVHEGGWLFTLNNYLSLVHEGEWLFTLNDYPGLVHEGEWLLPWMTIPVWFMTLYLDWLPQSGSLLPSSQSSWPRY